MAALIDEAVRAVPAAPDELVAVRLDGAELRELVRIDAQLVEEAVAGTDSIAAARERFRTELVRRVYRLYGEKLGGAAYRSFEDVQRALGSGGYLNRVVAKAFPRVTPETLVRRLTRRRAWSEADLALLDEAAALLNGPPHAYGHVIVDEAQDLTPMQLRALARRARGGSMTLVGDIAQAAGPVGLSRLGGAARRPGRCLRARGAPLRLPRSERDHGAGAAAPVRDCSRRRGADRLPPGR
jgi:hypothetical protein